MKKDSYYRWDFLNIWCIIETTTYPLLRWQDKRPPIADCGPDMICDVGIPVHFDGSRSSDDTGIANYTWTFNDGSYDIYLFGIAPSHNFRKMGIINVTLTVTDPVGLLDTDTLKITLIDTTRPIANAGPDQTVDEDQEVSFDGSASSDNCEIINYTWTFHDGISDRTLFGISPSHRFDIPGIYLVSLNVTDAVDLYDIDNMTLTVKDCIDPVADAGPDQTVNEGEEVFFDGSRSSDDGGISNYTWLFTDITTPVTLFGVNPSYTFHTPGTYNVILKVIDFERFWDTDSTMVHVRDITPPLADAGPDQIIDEGSPISFDGSLSRDNVRIDNYTWTFTDGSLTTLYGIDPIYTFNNPGNYTVTLNVTDAAGNWATDTLTVSVNDITKPFADAGPDRIVDEDTTFIFDGSGSYDNVGIVNFTWSFKDANDDIQLYGMDPTYIFNQPGIYQISLRVTDAGGLWSVDTFTLTVRDITSPIANAGSDRIVPVGSIVELSSIGSSDNSIIKYKIWMFIYDDEEHHLEGISISFKFDIGGIYEIFLKVIDMSDNIGEDTLTITVIDTGIVTGIVLYSDGKPVGDATVEIMDSKGNEHITSTLVNGSFSIEIHHGAFKWHIIKKGYGPISGNSCVDPMEEVLLDLSDHPMVKERRGGGNLPILIGLGILLLLILIGIAIYMTRKRDRSLEE
ncbi:MAG: PKD domain-containing protein [Candidatus Thermoplasmatota archaeon]|nr:PKD domain-containing protein [Candidatus Thermoplasmatota archaeon]